MIRMEHPELPKTVDDAPVQLWAKRQDLQVCLPASDLVDYRDRPDLRYEPGRDLLAQYGHGGNDPRVAETQAGRHPRRRDG